MSFLEKMCITINLRLLKKTPINEKLLETVIDQIKRKNTSQSRSKVIDDA